MAEAQHHLTTEAGDPPALAATDSESAAAGGASEAAALSSSSSSAHPAAGLPVVAPSAAVGEDAASEAETSEAQPHQPGFARKVVGAIGGIGYRIFDNMSFVGEVLVEWLELDKPRYHQELQELRRRKAKELKRKQQAEAEAIASIEEADAPTGAAVDAAPA
mmetsp:Transcript_3175/g.7605  ORF Transcript_3175/g.7605 Transcript_3175/m.7605 type:complete len:162 (-) Transcript_3175:41-526(-)